MYIYFKMFVSMYGLLCNIYTICMYWCDILCLIAHPPEFYDGVADTLERIAQKRSTKKTSPVKPEPVSIASESKCTAKLVCDQKCFIIGVWILNRSALTIAYCFTSLKFIFSKTEVFSHSCIMASLQFFYFVCSQTKAKRLWFNS